MERILDLLKTNQATLFLGAGTSMGVGGPSGGQLLDEIIAKFNDVELGSSKNFFDVCQDIVESGKYTRDDLIAFVKKRLEGLHPNILHKNLASLPWRCIFTTNYDLIIDRISSDELKGRRIRVVKDCKSPIDFNTELLHYFKIFGSIDATSEDDGYPILSRTEFNISFLNRDFFYTFLSDCIRRGPIVFIGYSFEDHLVFDLMAELYRRNKPDIIRESYAIIPNQPPEKIQRFFDQYNIKIIRGSFEEFVEKAHLKFKDESYSFEPSDMTIHIKGYPLNIPNPIVRTARQNFYFLNAESIESKYKDKKKFFNCEDTSFYPFFAHWDFIREIYSFSEIQNPEKRTLYGKNVTDGLKKHLFDLINNPQTEKNDITILTGPAGCGKTTIINRLAYDWYTSGHPVILMKPQGNFVDYKQLDYFVEYLETKIKTLDEKKGKTSKARSLIICDNCSSFIDDYFKAFEYLTARGRLFSMVFADRENLLENVLEDEAKEKFVIYSLPETVSENELHSFKEYLTTIGLIETEADLFGIIDNPTVNESFFALMYTIIDETRRPLNQIIHDQYLQLKDWPKNIFEYVCLFNNYHINPNEDLLVRCSRQKYETLRNEIDHGVLKKVIFIDDDEKGNIDYRVHHPIIAQRTVQIELREPTIKTQKFIEILNQVSQFYGTEVRKIEQLLVSGAGSNSFDKDLNLNLKKEIFKIACSRIRSRVLMHHYALLELEGENKNFDEAEFLLNRALKIKDSFERDELILTSLGKLYSSKGQYLETQGQHTDSLDAFQIAESYFKRGRTKHFKNKNAYHGQIVLYRRQADQVIDDLEKFKLFSKALDLCEEALCSLNISDQLIFFDEKLTILNLLKKFEDFEILVKKLAIQNRSAIGYKVKAFLLYSDLTGVRNDKPIVLEKDIQKLDEIEQIIHDGLEIEETNPDLLRLQATIGLIKYKDDQKIQYDFLYKWYNFATHPDVNLLFKYGILLFINESYKEARDIFKELSSQTQWTLNRSSIYEAYYLREDGINKEFEGIIVDMNSDRTKGLIKILSLPNLNYPIIFFPRFFASINDRVILHIAFNLRGPFAANVRKD